MQSLTFSNMSKAFSGIPAISNVTMNLLSGSVHALMGENGAGKSTLIKLIAGVLSADTMCVMKDGLPLSLNNPSEAYEAGFRFIHQELNIIPQVSVAENILLGRSLPSRFGFAIDWNKVFIQAKEALEFLGVDHIDVTVPAGDLSAGDKMMIKIASAFVSANESKPILYVLDEPTAALTSEESEKLFKVIERLKTQGATILYVSHRIDEILEICDAITILRDGELVISDEITNISKPEIIQAMTGRDFKSAYPTRHSPVGTTSIVAFNNASTAELKDISFDIREGEIIGVSGLADSGQSELLKLFMGIGQIRTGAASYMNKDLPRNPAEAWSRGIAYIPRERRSESLCLDMTITANILLPHLDKFGIFAKPRLEDHDALEFGNQVKLKSTGLRQPVLELSGGNQQKVVFARAIGGYPRILLLNDPTRGVDVGAKYEIYLLVRSLSASGCAVILTSTDLQEVLGICDRIIVMQNGRQAHLLENNGMTSADLLSFFYATSEAVI